MPLFFIIAIGAGAAALGASTAAVVDHHEESERVAPVRSDFQASAYGTYDECVRAAVAQHIATSVCQR